MMAIRKMSLTELTESVGITMVLKKGKAKAIRLSMLESICEILDCQSGDILEYVSENKKYSTHLNNVQNGKDIY